MPDMHIRALSIFELIVFLQFYFPDFTRQFDTSIATVKSFKLHTFRQ